MDNVNMPSFKILGLAVRTTNENGQSSQDIPGLWNQFMTDGIQERIPGKIDNTIYCVYMDYEKDHTKPYTTLIGCKVSSLDAVPHGMTGKTLPGGNYTKQTVTGNILKGLVFDTWIRIWNSDIPRVYTADFEVYGEKAKNPEHAEVDIYLAVN